MALLDGRAVVITGAGRGIGAATAKLMAEQGAQVVVNDLGVALDGSEASAGPAQQLVDEITSAGGTAVANTDDISDHTGAEKLIRTAIDSFGRLDAVINVAGILRDRMIFNMDPEDWEAVLKVHLTGTFNTAKHASVYWREQRDENAQARLINFTSGSGLFGAPGQPNYSAAKMGIVGLTLSCAKALAKYGVTSNCIAPGANTRMVGSIPDDRKAQMGLGDDLAPEHVARVVTWLASASSGWCNGRVIGSMGRKIVLYSNPAPQVELVARDAWDLTDLQSEVEARFAPVVGQLL